MPKSPFTVSQKGGKLAAGHLIGLGRRARDARGAMDDVRHVFQRSERERFESNARGRWAPLAARTQAKKSREGQDPRVLRLSGRLYESLTREGDPDQLDATRPNAMQFGTAVYYARFHDRGEGGVPKRKLIQLTAFERREATAILERFIARGTGRYS